MRITENMDLKELAELMGGANLSEATHMRASLNGIGFWSDTEEVLKSIWVALCMGARAQARHD